MRKRIALVSLWLLVVLATSACERDDQIRVYSAPKEASPAQTLVAATPEPGRPSGELRWTVPADWTETEPPQFATAAYIVSADDPNTRMTVSPLGIAAGALFPNVVRWQGQVGASPATSEEAVNQLARRIPTAAGEAAVFDLSGPRGRMLAAILPLEPRVWFFKLMGTNEAVEAQASNFEALVRSLRVGDDVEQASTQSPLAQAGSPAQRAEVDGASWTVPEGWVQGEQKQMRVATYRTSDDAGSPELIVTRFVEGRFGTLLDNINRWRGFAGLEPVAEESQQPAETIKIGGNDAKLYDLQGPKAHLRVAMVQVGNMVWFFRLTGPADAMAKQSQTFDEFLQSVQFK